MRNTCKKERIGETRKNKEELGSYKMKIVEYNNSHDIIIEFQDKHKVRVHTNYNNFIEGSVKNPYHPFIYDVGYIGVGKYNAKEHRRIWDTWHDMLKRCYDPYYINKTPSYIDCYVEKHLHNFQNFAKWYEENYYEAFEERMHLDKDILCKGNKIYSTETCIFVPQRINVLFTKSNKMRGEYPIGINYYKKYNCLVTRCNTLEKRIHLGYFSLDEPFKAFTTYKNFKENYIKKVADEYKELIPQKLYEALYKYEVEIND